MKCKHCKKEVKKLDYVSFQIHKGTAKPDSITQLNHPRKESFEKFCEYHCPHCDGNLANNFEEASKILKDVKQ